MIADRYLVYKHTSPEGKVYIGVTRWTNDPRNRWHYGHGYKYNKRFWDDIQRFGWANFQHEILKNNLTAEEAKQLEEFYITHFQSYDPAKGYNLARISVLPSASMTKEQELAKSRKISKWWCEENKRRKIHRPPHEPRQYRKTGPGSGHPMSEETRLKLCHAVTCLDTGTTYQSVREAASKTGIDPGNISAVCRGRRKTAGGLRWSYKTE